MMECFKVQVGHLSVCWKCKKPIKEDPHPIIQYVLGNIHKPEVVNAKHHMHLECAKQDLEDNTYLPEERKIAEDVIVWIENYIANKERMGQTQASHKT